MEFEQLEKAEQGFEKVNLSQVHCRSQSPQQVIATWLVLITLPRSVKISFHQNKKKNQQTKHNLFKLLSISNEHADKSRCMTMTCLKTCEIVYSLFWIPMSRPKIRKCNNLWKSSICSTLTVILAIKFFLLYLQGKKKGLRPGFLNPCLVISEEKLNIWH